MTMNIDVSVALATPEDAPLAVFGPEASSAVARLLEERHPVRAVRSLRVRPTIYGGLIGGPRTLYLRAHVTGGHGSSSEVSEAQTALPPTKIAAKYLAPYLEARDRAALR